MNAPIQLRGEVMSYGATLTRRLPPHEAKAILANIDGNRAVGIVHLAIMPTYQPGILNVEAWLETGTDPRTAAKALQVAQQRIRTIYELGPAPTLTVVEPRHANARGVAEQLVDMCRSSRLSAPAIHSFDTPREECVRAMMIALVGVEAAGG